MTHVRIVATLVLVLTVPVIAAQQLDQFERILLPVEPVYLRGVDRFYGAAVTYAGSHPARYYPASDLLGKPLGVGELMPSHEENLRITTTFPTNGAGRFLFLEKGAADDMELALSLNTGDAVYGALTAVPVVRESQFRTGRLTLPGIRLARYIECSPKFSGPCTTHGADRLKVYVYDADGTGSNAMLVRVWRHEQLRQETVLALNQRNGSDPSYPYYGVLEYDGTYDEYPQIVDIVSIELQPVHEHVRYWAFAIAIPWPNGGVTIFSPRP